MKRRNKIIIAVVALVVLALVAGCAIVIYLGRSSLEEFETTTAEEQDLAVTVTVSGDVEADVKADVYPVTAGTLQEVFVSDGEPVEAGETLATMDTAPMKAEVAGAEAAYQQALANLDSVRKQSPSQADLDAAAAATKAAWSAYQIAKAEADALEEAAEILEDAGASGSVDLTATILANPDYASQLQLLYPMTEAQRETQLAQADQAEEQAYAGYLQAKSQEATLLSQMRNSAQVTAAQAQVDQAAAALALASNNLEDSSLVAPMDGVVLFNSGAATGIDGSLLPGPEAGASVSPASPPFTVIELGSLQFVADIDEADVTLVKPGLAVEVFLDSFPLSSFLTKVERVGTVSQLTATGGNAFPAYMPLEDTGRLLRVGMQGSADIQTDELPGAITIPIEALFEEEGEDVVYTVVDGQRERRDVRVGVFTDMDVQILEGLEAGEEVSLAQPPEAQDSFGPGF